MNRELKLYAASRGVRQWEIARRWNVSEGFFSRMLRETLSEEDSKKFRQLVDEIADEKGRD